MTGAGGPERFLPRGTARRRAARVGAQVARDARDYSHRLKDLWRAAQDGPDDYAGWFAGHRASAAELEDQRARAASDPFPISFLVVIGDDPAQVLERALQARAAIGIRDE